MLMMVRHSGLLEVPATEINGEDIALSVKLSARRCLRSTSCVLEHAWSEIMHCTTDHWVSILLGIRFNSQKPETIVRILTNSTTYPKMRIQHQLIPKTCRRLLRKI